MMEYAVCCFVTTAEILFPDHGLNSEQERAIAEVQSTLITHFTVKSDLNNVMDVGMQDASGMRKHFFLGLQYPVIV